MIKKRTDQIIGVFDDETPLLEALKKLKSQGIKIIDLYGPCVDHDVLRSITRESRLSYFSFLAALMVVVATFAAIYYITVIDYPKVYGGKPIFSFPPMVVVMFLVTILGTGTFTSLAFLGLVRFYPGKPRKPDFPGSLDDTYYLVLRRKHNADEVIRMLRESGAKNIIENEN